MSEKNRPLRAYSMGCGLWLMNTNGHVEGSIGLAQAIVWAGVHFGGKSAGDAMCNGVPRRDGYATMSLLRVAVILMP